VKRTSEDGLNDDSGAQERRPSNGPTAGLGAAQDAGQPADDFVVLDSEPGAFVFGAWKNVLVIVWKSQATASSVARFAKAIEVMAARSPGRRSNIHVIQQGAPLPTAESRAGFVELMKRNKDSLACVAIVIAGIGFWSGALRGAMIGVRLLSPRSFEFRVAGSSEEVCRWLPAAHQKKTGVSLDPRRLAAVLEAAAGSIA
jgi:hypothetical protein